MTDARRHVCGGLAGDGEGGLGQMVGLAGEGTGGWGGQPQLKIRPGLGAGQQQCAGSEVGGWGLQADPAAGAPQVWFSSTVVDTSVGLRPQRCPSLGIAYRWFSSCGITAVVVSPGEWEPPPQCSKRYQVGR